MGQGRGKGRDVGSAVTQKPRTQGLMAISLMGKACSKCYALSFKGLGQFRGCDSFETGSKSSVASNEAPFKAGVPLALRLRPASGCIMSICSIAFFFRRLLAHPAGMGWHFRTRSLELVADFLELVAGRSKLRPLYHTK